MIELIDSLSTIQKNINKAIAQDMNLLLLKKKYTIETECKRIVSKWILDQPEIKSLQSDVPYSLSGQFGLTPGADIIAVNDIITAVENSIHTKIIKFDQNLNGGLFVYFQPSNFANLLGLVSGHVFYNNGDLHWLEWLLKEGDNIIVINYSYNPKIGIGRSKLGNMTKSGSFRVPPEFSGTEQNNFITRALIGSDQEKNIENIFMKVLS